MENLGIPPGLEGFRLYLDGRISAQFKWAMRVLSMTREELQWLEKQRVNNVEELNLKIPSEVDEAAFDTISAVCEDVLGKYPHTVQQDTAILEGMPESADNMRAAVTLRRGEKRILKVII